MALQRKRHRCTSDEGPNCVFLHDESLQEQYQTLHDVDIITKQTMEVAEYELFLTFQTFDQITRRYKDFIPDAKVAVDFGGVNIEIYYTGLKLSNDKTPKEN